MRITDILFFGLLFICITTVFVSLLSGFNIPSWFQFWWVLLLPVVILKVFLPKNKITQWFEKERW
jgi:hypothetical protein